MKYILFLLVVLLPVPTHATTWETQFRDTSNRNSVVNQPSLSFVGIGTVASAYSVLVTHNTTIIGTVSSGNQRKIVAYDQQSLLKKWEYSIGSEFPGQPIIDGSNLYFALVNKPTIVVLDLGSGQLTKILTIPGERLSTIQPIIHDEVLYIFGQQLTAIDLSNVIQWQKATSSSSPAATDGSSLFIRTRSQTVVSLSLKTGEQQWFNEVPTTFGTHPVIDGSIVYVGLYNRILAYDKTSGSELWSYTLPVSVTQITGLGLMSDRLIIGTNDGRALALNREGKSLWQNRFNATLNQGNGWSVRFIITGDLVLTQANQNEQLILDGKNGAILFQGSLIASNGSFTGQSGDLLFFKSDITTYLLKPTQWTKGSTGELPTVKRRDPILIVPGLLESWPVKGQWQLDPFIGMYQTFLASLEEAGYFKEQDYFLFPYDWHRSNRETAKLLEQKIQAVKRQTGSEKVDIVAHSMGGIIARVYIQSQSYANDIDELITIATPHKGATKAYLAWEGGKVGTAPLDKLEEQLLNYESVISGYGTATARYIRSQLPSMQELLPITDYLWSNDLLLAYQPCRSLFYPCNPLLEELAATANKLTGVSITSIAGTLPANNTLSQLIVNAHKDWPHGIPLQYPDSTGLAYESGDGTVLPSSALLEGSKQVTIEATHVESVSKAAQMVVKQLSDKDVGLANWVAPNRYLFLRVYSPVSLVLTDSKGQRIGYDPQTEQSYNEIPNTYFNTTDSHQYVIISNYDAEPYSITLIGTGDGSYRLEASLTDDPHDTVASLQGTITNHEVKNIYYQPQQNRFQVVQTVIAPLVTYRSGSATPTPAISLDSPPPSKVTVSESMSAHIITIPPTTSPAPTSSLTHLSSPSFTQKPNVRGSAADQQASSVPYLLLIAFILCCLLFYLLKKRDIL